MTHPYRVERTVVAFALFLLVGAGVAALIGMSQGEPSKNTPARTITFERPAEPTGVSDITAIEVRGDEAHVTHRGGMNFTQVIRTLPTGERILITREGGGSVDTLLLPPLPAAKVE